MLRQLLKHMQKGSLSMIATLQLAQQLKMIKAIIMIWREKELLRKKKEELEEAERAKRNRVVMTFDLLGRKVLLNEDEASEETQNRILLRPPEEREEIRINQIRILKFSQYLLTLVLEELPKRRM